MPSSPCAPNPTPALRAPRQTNVASLQACPRASCRASVECMSIGYRRWPRLGVQALTVPLALRVCTVYRGIQRLYARARDLSSRRAAVLQRP